MSDDIPLDEFPPEEVTGIIIPPRKRPADDNGYFEVLAQVVFLAGFSWKVVRDKWPGFRRAFDNFDYRRIARYDIDDVERLLSDPGIVRNGRKIEAVIANARRFRDIVDEYGSFYAYLRSLDSLTYAQRRRVLSKQFKWIGRTGVFVFLWCVEEEVPDWENR